MRTIPSIAPFMALTYASIGAVHGLLALSVRAADDDGPLDASADASMDASRRGDTAAAAALARWSAQGGLGRAAGPLLRRALPACNLLLLLRSLNLAAATGETLLPALGAALSLGPFCASAWLCPQLWRLAAGGKPPRAEPKRSPLTPAQAPSSLVFSRREGRAAQMRSVSDGCALRGVLPQVIRNWQMHIGRHGHGRSHRH